MYLPTNFKSSQKIFLINYKITKNVIFYLKFKCIILDRFELKMTIKH